MMVGRRSPAVVAVALGWNAFAAGSRELPGRTHFVATGAFAGPAPLAELPTPADECAALAPPAGCRGRALYP
jgi:hypothetical protein